MRMPSSPSPWLPLALSLAVHSLLLLPFAFRPEDDARRSPIIDTVVRASGGPLQVDLIGLPQRRAAASKIDEVSPALDTSVTLIEPPVPAPAVTPGVFVNPNLTSPAPGSSASDPAGGSANDHGGGGGGRGLRFFEVAAPGKSVVFVLDRSVSMGLHGALNRARAELTESLRRLPPDATFQIVAYNARAEPLFLNGQTGLLPARPDLLSEAAGIVAALQPSGSTNHLAALQQALRLRPDVIYFVTDADELSPKDVAKVTGENQGRTAIHAIELSCRRAPDPDSPLLRLANLNRGTYRCVAPEP